MARKSRILIPLIAAAMGFALSVPAGAATVVINDQDLIGKGPTTWDPQNDYAACDVSGFTPVVNGLFGAVTDPFDGGGMIAVDGTGFAAPGGAAGTADRLRSVQG